MQGLHLMADLRDCAPEVPLADLDWLRALCGRAVRAAGLQPVGEVFHPFRGDDGQPLGVTGVVLLAESHVAIHTWPELRGVTADVYVCNLGADNSVRARHLMATLVEALRPGTQRIESVRRG